MTAGRHARHALRETVASLSRIERLAADGDRRRYETDAPYRWAVHQLWIAVGHQALDYCETQGVDIDRAGFWTPLYRLGCRLAHDRPADVDEDAVWRMTQLRAGRLREQVQTLLAEPARSAAALRPTSAASGSSEVPRHTNGLVPPATGPPSRPQHPTGDGTPRRVGPILVATCGSSVLVMATTAAGTGILPVLARDLQPSQTEIQWIGDSYPLVLAALLLPAGSLLDRYGRKRGLVAGLAILAVALAFAGMADSPAPLILARALAGVGAALAFPATLATISNVIPEERRGSAVGLWAATAVSGGLLGILLAGGLTEFAWWGSVFLALAALTVLCLIVTVLVVPETSDPEHANLDPLGALASVVAIGALVFAVTEGPVHGWTDGRVVGVALVGLLAGAAFVAWELRTSRPLVDLRLFRNPSVATSSVALFLMFFGIYGWFYLCFQYESFVFGWSPFKTALGFLPLGVAVLVTAPFAPAIARRRGRRLVISTALGISAAGYALMALLGGAADYGVLGPAFLVLGLGVGVGCTPPTEAILEALPPAQQGVASAINDTARELGAAVGIAVIGSAFNAGYRESVGDALAAVPAPLAEAIRSSPAAGFGALAQAGVQAPVELAQVIRDGVVSGWGVAFVVTATVTAAATVYVARCFPTSKPEAAAPDDVSPVAAIRSGLAPLGRHRGRGPVLDALAEDRGE